MSNRPILTRRGLLLAGLGLGVSPALAQEALDPRLVAAANRFALAQVLTGDEAVDAMASAGLRGLSMQLAARTTVEPGPVVAIDLDADDISVLSLLYWPITEDQPPPSPAAYLMLERWLRDGGLLVVDTRDADVAGLMPSDAPPAAGRLLAPLAIPPLAPIPADHVLTRSYYLLDSFPGRHDGGTVWVEAAPVSPEGQPLGGALNDGVTPVVIGGNAWADAWAVDEAGLPLNALGAGFEGERQRELAYRFGINLAMLALTGNYKSDQVHVPAILDRLGRREDLP